MKTAPALRFARLVVWKKIAAEGFGTGRNVRFGNLNDDGQDEFAIGYSLLDHDGRKLWSLDGKMKDHADAVAIVKLQPDEKQFTLLHSASDQIVVWDAQEMWAYTQSDNPKPGPLHRPKRTPV